MLVTCRMQYAMSVSTVLQCGDVVSPGEKYAFATVMPFVLTMSIMINCSFVLCVPMAKSPRREHIAPVLKSLHWLKIQDRITYKILMPTYKSYYNIAPTYLCELISRRESSVNSRLAADHHQLIMPPISKDCSNTFLERSFIYAAPCEWNKLSECIRTSTFDSFMKSVKTMLFTLQYGC